MKKKTFGLLTLFAVFVINSIAQGTWTRIADFGGTGRYGAVGFSIGNKGYLGTGADNAGSYTKDFWEYNPNDNTWTQKADFGGTARRQAIGFSIGSKGYVGTGFSFDGINHYNKDFWQYDPAANTWTQKADFGGSGREGSVGFYIGNRGYVGTGHSYSGTDIYYKDFWEYNPDADTWIRKADFGGTPRSYAAGFGIGSKGYLGTGFDNSNNVKNDFWEYDPAINTWSQKVNALVTNGAVGFSIGSKGYIGTGGFDPTAFWEYDPNVDTWSQKADFGGTERQSAVGFSIGDKGYLGTGSSYTLTKDFWEYTPGTGCAAPSDLRATKITDTSAVLRWSLPAETPLGYKIRYRAVGTTDLIKRNIISPCDHFVLCGLQPNTTYEWQIRANCVADTSTWVNGPNFTTAPAIFAAKPGALNIAGIKLNNLFIRVAPNPSTGNFTLQMQLPAQEAATTISLYNNLGEKVWQQYVGKLSGSSNHNIALPNKLQTGIYILKVERSGIELIQRIVINK